MPRSPKTHKNIDITAVSQAIEDIPIQVGREFITKHGFEPGSWEAWSLPRLAELKLELPEGSQTFAAGSAASSLIEASRDGKLRTYLVTCVANDAAGIRYHAAIDELGIDHERLVIDGEGFHTGQSLILISETEDRKIERTMRTALGVAGELTPDDISEEVIAASHYVLWEAFDLKGRHGSANIKRVIEFADRHDTKVAIGLADAGLVSEERLVLEDLLSAPPVEMLFADMSQIAALSSAKDVQGTESAVEYIASRYKLNIIATDGAQPIRYTAARADSESKFVQRFDVDPLDPAKIIDPTGAGDVFAGRVLAELVKGASVIEAITLGAQRAAQVIQVIGPRD